jgi:hypothetical protein
MFFSKIVPKSESAYASNENTICSCERFAATQGAAEKKMSCPLVQAKTRRKHGEIRALRVKKFQISY